ncbi:MBL fold metallo-hydrolase [Cohnella caldifontis]|uniref:MBL fold metallo-hydrolase n=1 Tax=Cohnella caldifontis TaxID=3027471 RepID=UPI0023EA9420|nr:MBL fold metallo-hydrolase [Cohnella sp. YIM B05605]
MKITQIGQVYQLSFLPRVFPVNCYFVEEEDSLTLIDAALPSSDQAILRAAAGIGKPIARIVLTHAHGDHIGALDKLKAALPNAKVYVSRRDARLLGGDKSLDPEEPATPIRGGVPKPGAIRTKPDVLLEDGDRVGSLLAVSAPGHTPGSMAFYDTRGGALIAGDAMQTRGGIAVTGQFKIRFPFPAMATWNKEAALSSVRRLRELEPSLLCVGHGVMVERPAAVMDRAMEEAAAERKRKAGG